MLFLREGNQLYDAHPHFSPPHFSWLLGATSVLSPLSEVFDSIPNKTLFIHIIVVVEEMHLECHIKITLGKAGVAMLPCKIAIFLDFGT